MSTRHVVSFYSDFSSNITSPGKPSVPRSTAALPLYYRYPAFYATLHVIRQWGQIFWSWFDFTAEPWCSPGQCQPFRRTPTSDKATCDCEKMWPPNTALQWCQHTDRKHCRPARSQLPSLPADMDDSCFFTYPSPGLTLFLSVYFFGPPHAARGGLSSLRVCVHTQLLCCVWIFVTPWTVAHQAPLSMGFSRQEY